MASCDLVILSSSPPAASPRNAKVNALPASSPQRVRMAAISLQLLSPPKNRIVTSIGASKSDSQVADLPNGATRGFATASSLLKSHHFDLEHDYELPRIPTVNPGAITTEAPETTKKPRTRVAKAAATDKGNEPDLSPKKASARKPKTDVAIPREGASTTGIATAPSHSLSKPLKSKPKTQRSRKTTKADVSATTTASFHSPTATISGPIPPPVKPEDELPIPLKPKTTRPRKLRKTEAKRPDNPNGDILAERTNVTKTKPAVGTREKSRQKVTGAISTHFVSENPCGKEQNPQAPRQIQDTVLGDSIWNVPASLPEKGTSLRGSTPVDKHLPLQLEDAVPRRQGWTPTKDTRSGIVAFTSSSGVDNEARDAQQAGAFTSMLSGFTSAFAQPQTGTSARAISEGSGLANLKKRPIDLIDIPGNSANPRDTLSEKTKAPKKKARTVTDHVLAQYAPGQPQHVGSSTAAELFELRTASIKIPLKDEDDGSSKKVSAKPIRKRASSKKPPSLGSTKSKKPSTKARLVADKLLSPTTAITKMNRQKVLFGTSSQLALEESPTYVRHMQQAIRESEQDIESVTCGQEPRSRSCIMHRLGKVRGKKQLWAASARDEDGMLHRHESEVHVPKPDQTKNIPLMMDGAGDEAPKSDGFADIDDLVLCSPAKHTHASGNADAAQARTILDGPVRGSTKIKSQVFTRSIGQTSLADVDEYTLPPPSNQQQAESSSFLDIDDFSMLPLPKAASHTHPSTSCAIPSALEAATTANSLGSPINTLKSLSEPQCVTTRPPLHQTSSRTQTSTLSVPSTPPKSQRYANVDEILDSENDEALSPTPPRLFRPFSVSELPLAPFQPAKASKPSSRSLTRRTATGSDATPITLIPVSHLSWETVKPTVFAGITSHIRSLPRSTNIMEQTWHEKILQYIPIPLEDFTSYLNSHTEIRTWKKATQVQIKAWRKRCKADGGDGSLAEADQSGKKAEEMVAAVEKDLEVAMVQAWCQEMSICCFARDLRKGGVRKGLY